MLTGSQGETRPADVVGCAVHVMRIATGEIEDSVTETRRQPSRAKGGWQGPRGDTDARTPK